MKKLLSIALSLCLLLSVALADVTLTKVYKTEDLVSNTFHNGFVTAIGMTGENTVVLKDDGTYEYTKRLMQTAEDGTVAADLVYTFTGTYTKDGDTVVLMFPTAGTASENWGPLAGSYFQNTENAAFADSDYAAGVVQCKEAESHLIADLFEGPYLLDSLTTVRYPRARMRRLAMDAALDYSADAFPALPPYLHLLGAQKDALPLLKAASLPVSHSLARLAEQNVPCRAVVDAQLRACDFGALCRKKPEPMGGALRQKIIFLTN